METKSMTSKAPPLCKNLSMFIVCLKPIDLEVDQSIQVSLLTILIHVLNQTQEKVQVLALEVKDSSHNGWKKI